MRRRSRPAPQPTSLRLPLPLRRRLEARAAREDRPLSVLMVRLLEQEMNRLDGEHQFPLAKEPPYGV